MAKGEGFRFGELKHPVGLIGEGTKVPKGGFSKEAKAFSLSRGSKPPSPDVGAFDVKKGAFKWRRKK